MTKNKKLIVSLIIFISLLSTGVISYAQYQVKQEQQKELQQKEQQKRQQIRDKRIKFEDEVTNSIESADYSKTYKLVSEYLQKETTIYDSLVRSIEYEVYKLIESKKYGQVIAFYSFGKHKLFDIDRKLQKKIIETHDNKLIHFLLSYLLELTEDNKSIFLSSGSSLSLDDVYYLALSLGDISIVKRAEGKLKELGKFDEIKRYEQGKILNHLVEYGSLNALQYALKEGLFKQGSYSRHELLKGYITSYPQSKEALKLVLANIQQTKWSDFDENSIKSINGDLIDNQKEGIVTTKEVFDLLKKYGYIDKISSYKKQEIKYFYDFDYQMFLFYAWMGDNSSFENYLKLVNPSLINLDDFNYREYTSIYPVEIFSYTNNMKGVYLLEKYGYSFEKKPDILDKYIDIAGYLGAVDVAKYYIKQHPNFDFNERNNYIRPASYDKTNPKHKVYILYLIDNSNYENYQSGDIWLLDFARYNDKDILLAAFNKGLKVNNDGLFLLLDTDKGFEENDFSKLDNYDINPEIKELIRNKKKQQDLEKSREKQKLKQERNENELQNSNAAKRSEQKTAAKQQEESQIIDNEAIKLYKRGRELFEDENNTIGRVPKYSDRASTDYFKRSAELGYDKAQYSYAHTFGGGLGNSFENIDKANTWFKKAAVQGHIDAQLQLGSNYSSLDEIISNSDHRIQSYMWYGLAKLNPNKESHADFNYLVSLRMTKKEIQMAKEAIKECYESKYKKCYGVEY